MWALGEGSIFQLVRGPLKIEFEGIFKQKEQFDPNLFESCVDFEVAHLSRTHGLEIAIPDIPTLKLWACCVV